MRFTRRLALFPLLLLALAPAAGQPPKERLFLEKLNVNPPHIRTDKSVKYDYDIVYVRARRTGDKIHKRFYTDIATPVTLEPGADLMLLHPDGSEELLIEGGEGGGHRPDGVVRRRMGLLHPDPLPQGRQRRPTGARP